MRKSEREIKDFDKIIDIIKNTNTIRLGLNDDRDITRNMGSLLYLCLYDCFVLQLLVRCAVVGGLTGDGNVVRMALKYTGAGDACELGLV